MSTRYHRNGHAAYECSASRADQTATATCRSISAVSVDQAVAERLLEALNPEEVALALAAADEVADRRARRSRAAELAVERARYQADRAERAFHACEPENRLVARSLESRWESRLAALAEAEKALTQAHAAVPSLPSRTELQALTANVSGLWHAPTTAARDRKRLLRTLVADVTLLPEPDLAKARIGIRWHTGATDEVVIARRQSVVQYRRTHPAAVELARRLGPTRSNAELAARLNEVGYRTGAGRPFDNAAVANLRQTHSIPPPGLLRDDEVTVAEAARRLGVSANTVYEWIKGGKLAARRGFNGRLCVPFGPDTERACRERVAGSTQIARDVTTSPAGPHERTVAQVAATLAINTNVVYYWLETGWLHARKGPGGRWLVAFTANVESQCRQRIAASVHLKPVSQPQTSHSTTRRAV
jgi:excisionase family DNA binding protein